MRTETKSNGDTVVHLSKPKKGDKRHILGSDTLELLLAREAPVEVLLQAAGEGE